MFKPCFGNLLLWGAFLLPTGRVMAAAWVDEGFETYADHKELLAAWPVEGKHQDARNCEEQCAGRGTHSLMELPNEDSRHLRVFDATNSVNGTDECPLHLSYGLFMKNDLAKTFRTCELLNSQTGDRIGIGPALHSTYLQVFDGTAWRDLAFAPERAAGWTSFDVIIKTDRLCITVTNARGRSYEEVARATHAGFGTLAIGSGRANGNAPSYVDNVVVDGGTLTGNHPLQRSAAALGPEEMAYVFRANTAIRRLYGGGKGQEVLAELESMLEELERRPANEKVRAQMALPWIYEAIATVKNMSDAPPEELRAIHCEAILKAPDGIGADVAVRSLAQLLNEPEKTNCLLNLCREFKATSAARAAAQILAQPQEGGPASTFTSRLRDLAEAGANPFPTIAAPKSMALDSLLYLLESVEGVADRVAMLSQSTEQLAKAGDIQALESLGRWAVGSGRAEYVTDIRESLCKVRFAQGDVFGGLAVLSDRALGDERAVLVRDLDEAADADAVRELLRALVNRAVKARLAVNEQVEGFPPAQTPEEALWQVIAREAEQCGFMRVAMAAFQQLSRSGERFAAADSARLDERFAPKDAGPEEMVRFWKAQWLIDRDRAWQAEPLLAGLAQAKDAVLRGQASFELARVRRSRHRPESASQPTTDCEALLPNSPGVRDLKVQVARDLARVQERKQSYDALDAAWVQIRQTRDAVQAASTLIAVSEIESRLNSPERAAEALEVLIAKYPDAAVLPAGLDRLARIYERDLERSDKARAVRERLTREYPQYEPAQTRPGD